MGWIFNNKGSKSSNDATNIKFENIKEKDIREATDIVLRDADAILDEILAIPDSLRTFENTLLRLDVLYNVVSKVWNPLEPLVYLGNQCIPICMEPNAYRIQKIQDSIFLSTSGARSAPANFGYVHCIHCVLAFPACGARL